MGRTKPITSTNDMPHHKLRFWDRGYFVQQGHLHSFYHEGHKIFSPGYEIFSPLPLTVEDQMQEEALYFYVAMYNGQLNKVTHYWHLLQKTFLTVQLDIETSFQTHINKIFEKTQKSVFESNKKFQTRIAKKKKEEEEIFKAERWRFFTIGAKNLMRDMLGIIWERFGGWQGE